jgi:hypothetical protein
MAISGPTSFSQSVLAFLGDKPTKSNLQFLNEWQGAEGQWGASGNWNAAVNNNPLNLESVPPGAGVIPSGSHNTGAPYYQQIEEFQTPQAGAQATAAFINQPNYPNIQQALGSGNAMSAFQQGQLNSELSKWGTNPANFATPVKGNSTPNVGASGQTSSTSAQSAVTNIRKGLVPNIFPGGKLDPLNWLTGTAEINTLWYTLFPLLVIGFGILLVIAGMFLTFKGQTKVNVQVPSGGGGGSAQAKGGAGEEGAEAGGVADEAALAAA